MKSLEQIIEYLEVEIDLARKTARTYFKEYAKGEGAFISRDKCLEMYNTYLTEYVKLVEVLNFIKGRLKFNDGKQGAPFPSMLVIYK